MPDQSTTSKTVGPCLVETIGTGNPAVEEPLSAGTVHLTGGLKAVDLVPAKGGDYTPVTGNQALWNGGETLSVAADGSDVPAFMTSLTAPSKVTLTAPMVPSTGPLVITRSAGVSATFTGTSGDVVLYFEAMASAQQVFAATCTFKASDGAAQIPADVFADFPAATGTFDFYVKESSTATPVGWSVRFTASRQLVDAQGQALIGDATFN